MTQLNINTQNYQHFISEKHRGFAFVEFELAEVKLIIIYKYLITV